MRYPASEKTEIITIVEQSHLSVRKTLEQIGVPRATFYRWYEQYQTGGPEALGDRPSQPSRIWNRIPDDVRTEIITLALEQPEAESPGSWRVRFPFGPEIGIVGTLYKTSRRPPAWQTGPPPSVKSMCFPYTPRKASAMPSAYRKGGSASSPRKDLFECFSSPRICGYLVFAAHSFRYSGSW